MTHNTYTICNRNGRKLFATADINVARARLQSHGKRGHYIQYS